jgi:hypothetical protein
MSALSVMLPGNSFVRISDPKTVAGQQAWERARDIAIAFAREPSTAVGAKLLAHVAEGSDIGDPRKPDWLPRLPANKRVKVMEELQQLVASWNRVSGGHTDGSRSEAVKALQVAAMQAGPGHADMLAKAAIAEQELAADLATSAASRQRTASPDDMLYKAGRVG